MSYVDVGAERLQVFNCAKRLWKMSPTTDSGQKTCLECKARTLASIPAPKKEVPFTAINSNSALLCEDRICDSYIEPRGGA